MSMMFLTKFKALDLTVALAALAATGAGTMTLRLQAAKESAPPVVADKPLSPNKPVDLYGDPLPEGAVMRLGTIQRRAAGAVFAVSADGKSVLSVRAGKYLRVWDAATGKLREKRELPGDSFHSSAEFSPDGRLLAVHNVSAAKLRIWDVSAGKIIRMLPLANRASDDPSSDAVLSLSFTPEGKHLSALDADSHGKNHIRVWDIKNGKELFRQSFERGRSWQEATDRIVLAASGNHLYVILVSHRNGLLCCWDVATGRQVWEQQRGWEEAPYSIVVTPEGTILCSVTPRGTILSTPHKSQALDLATGRMLKLAKPLLIDTHSQLRLTSDGRSLLIANEKGVAVWDWRHGKKLRMLPGTGEEIIVLPDDKSIIANNGALQRWDLATGKPLWTDTFEHGHVGEVLDLAFSADGRRLASTSADGSVRLWDTTTGRPLRVWRGHTPRRPIPLFPWVDAGVTSMAISADGRWVFSAGSTDDLLKLWDAAADKEARTIVAHQGETGFANPLYYKVAMDATGDRVVAIFGGAVEKEDEARRCMNKLATWNLKTGELLASHSIEHSSHFFDLSLERGWARMGGVLVDIATGKEAIRLNEVSAFDDVTGAFSRDGAVMASIVERRGLCVLESATGKLIAQVKDIRYKSRVLFHPLNHLLATNDLDGIQLWDLRSGKTLAHFRIPEPVRVGIWMEQYTLCLAFTRDGRRLAAGIPDGTILLWDVPLPASHPQRLEAKELESLWADLADTDSAKAWRAVWRLADAPNDALAFLRGRVKPYPTAPAEVTRKLLADLDSDSFENREAARKRLKELGLQAEPALRVALQAKPSLEQRRRIEDLLTNLSTAPSPPTSDELRQLRTLIVLEGINSSEARRLLEEIAKGPETARLTRQARAALVCRRE
jgi:WD40 repeat protein